MRQWWIRLEARERLLVGVAGVLLVVAAYYGLVLQPLQDERARQLARQGTLQDSLGWMIEAGQRVQGSRAAGAAASGTGSLLSVVDRAARADGIKPAIKQLNPEGDSLVRVTLDAVEFNRVLRWLARMHEAGIRLDAMTVTRDPAPGQVKGRLTLSRG